MTPSWWNLHDPAIRLSLREQVRLHWLANLRMLRSPRAVLRFTVVSLLPFAAWLLGCQLLARATAGRWSLLTGDGFIDLLLLTLPLYLVAQHLGFMRAMQDAYVPFVRRTLRDLGHPTCIACGQRFATGEERVCAECGRERE